MVILVTGNQGVGKVATWVRRMLPAAFLLVAPAGAGASPTNDSDAIVVDADDGPLSIVHKVIERYRT